MNQGAIANTETNIVLHPVIDDRMFTMCFFLNTPAFYNLRGETNYETDDFWYAYLFVDSNPKDLTIKYLPMQQQLVQQSSYCRWLNNGSNGKSTGHIFGATRYSFVILGAEAFFNQNFLINHFRYIYFQVVSLALVQRASILRFSGEAARMMQLLKTNKVPQQQLTSIKELYLEYIYFINKILYREITPQEQGIELYDLIRRNMEIDTDAKLLEKEIGDLHQYSLLLENEESTKQSEYLNNVATFFAPFALIAGVLGFSLSDLGISFLWALSVFIIFSLVIWGIVLLLRKMKKL